MSRIGQAFSMCAGQFYWDDPDSGNKLTKALPKVTPDHVEAVIVKYLQPERMSVVVVQ